MGHKKSDLTQTEGSDLCQQSIKGNKTLHLQLNIYFYKCDAFLKSSQEKL